MQKKSVIVIALVVVLAGLVGAGVWLGGKSRLSENRGSVGTELKLVYGGETEGGRDIAYEGLPGRLHSGVGSTQVPGTEDTSMMLMIGKIANIQQLSDSADMVLDLNHPVTGEPLGRARVIIGQSERYGFMGKGTILALEEIKPSEGKIVDYLIGDIGGKMTGEEMSRLLRVGDVVAVRTVYLRFAQPDYFVDEEGYYPALFLFLRRDYGLEGLGQELGRELEALARRENG